jgi:hypothetical protein
MLNHSLGWGKNSNQLYTCRRIIKLAIHVSATNPHPIKFSEEI